MDLDCTPQVTNLVLYAGDDAILKLTVLDVDGNPMDLGSGELRAEIRETPEDTERFVIDLAVDPTDAATGIVYVWFKAADTTACFLDGGGIGDALHRWDIQHDNGGGVMTITGGSVRTRGDITKAAA